MSRPTVVWFGNPHEHSLHYVKFGLMRLARDGAIDLREIDNARAHADLLPPAVREHVHRRTAAVRVHDGVRNRLVILDGEDSVFQTSPLIAHCDRYFSCAYRRRFFAGEPFDLALPWQTEPEIAWYRSEYGRLQREFAAHLGKARPLGPIGPAMEWTAPPPFLKARLDGLRHRWSLRQAPFIEWSLQHERFERRWAHLHALRESPLRHDIVLKDSLWGWPRHRLALHRRLGELTDRHDIRAELHYHAPTPHCGEADPSIRSQDFPIVTGGGVEGDYEAMLAAARIGVFSTGFHWGCRNIVTLAWFLGLKVLSDPFAHESWFDYRKLGTEFTRGTGDWSEVAELLARFSREDALAARPRIQAAFDRLMSPEICARRVVEETLDEE